MMESRRSDSASQIRQLLSMREVAERYGFEPNFAGFIKCPFHSGDKHGSLKIYDGSRGWHCFGCHAGGSVIDFAMKLFDLSFRDAVARLSTDFGLNLTSYKASRKELEELDRARQRAAEEKAAIEAEYRAKAAEHRYYYELIKNAPPILQADGSIYYHPLYADAIKKIPILEDWLNENIGR